MITFKTACAAGALLLASLAAASPSAAERIVPVPGTGGGYVYDGRTPPSCNVRDIRVRHFEGDGHSREHSAHAHLGHGHRWAKRNYKGHPTKPPCYVRRAGTVGSDSSIQPIAPIARESVAIGAAISGDLS